MEFNDTKWEVLRISRSKTPIQHTYYLHGTPLKEVDHAKYLGIWYSKDLKWIRHIDEITAKANRTLGFLKRNLRANSSTLKPKAYKSLVRPQVEYCSSVWDPRPGVENNGSNKIERIQRRAVRWCLRRYNNTSSVTNMLEDLTQRDLEQSRIFNSHGLLRPVMRRTRRSHQERLPTSLSSEYLSYFSRTIIRGNNLPASVFSEHCSLDTFKAHVSCLNHLPVCQPIKLTFFFG